MSSQTPTLDQQLCTRLGVDYLEQPFFFYVGSTQTPDNFAGCTLSGGIYLNGALKVDLGASTGYAQLTQPTRVDVRVPASVIAGLGPGVYNVALALLTPNATVQDLVDYSLKVVNP